MYLYYLIKHTFFFFYIQYAIARAIPCPHQPPLRDDTISSVVKVVVQPQAPSIIRTFIKYAEAWLENKKKHKKKNLRHKGNNSKLTITRLLPFSCFFYWRSLVQSIIFFTNKKCLNINTIHWYFIESCIEFVTYFYRKDI